MGSFVICTHYYYYFGEQMKEGGMGWEGHVAAWERRGLHLGFWWQLLKEGDYLEDVGIWEDNIKTVDH
jgi:hypothetical protein